MVGILTASATTGTGIMADNLVGHLDTADEELATGENTGLYAFNNLMTAVITDSGFIQPVVDS